MKQSTKIFLPIVAMLLCAGACKKETNNGNQNPDPSTETLPDGSVLTGEITSTIKLGAGNTYWLKGGVHVKPGHSLYIEPGVTVKSDPDEPATAYLLVEPGATIMAEGTKESPIVFTSGKKNPTHQDWGGIILCGKAPVNVAGGTVASEMGAGVVYGGDDPNDNSGVLRYVRVEYTGKKQTQTKEHNGFTFEGVGAGTTLEYLAVYKGGDDGIEFFGGTVNARYLFVYGAQDDLFDWTYGWSGKGQFWVGIQGDDVADRGIEADNNGSDNAATPFSNPTLSNITLVGSTTAKTGDDPASASETGKTRAIKLREGTKGALMNCIVYNFNSGVEVEHDQTLANMEDGSLSLKHTDIYNEKLWSFKKTGGDAYTGDNRFIEAAYHNHTSITATPPYISQKYIGTNTDGAVNPASINGWFQVATYKGAVEQGNDWTAGWTKK
jgi:hypothetical protein